MLSPIEENKKSCDEWSAHSLHHQMSSWEVMIFILCNFLDSENQQLKIHDIICLTSYGCTVGALIPLADIERLFSM